MSYPNHKTQSSLKHHSTDKLHSKLMKHNSDKQIFSRIGIAFITISSHNFPEIYGRPCESERRRREHKKYIQRRKFTCSKSVSRKRTMKSLPCYATMRPSVRAESRSTRNIISKYPPFYVFYKSILCYHNRG